MSISLRPITNENWEDCIQLQVAPHQQTYVAPNLYSLEESKFEQSFVPMGIYLDDRMIGFLMYGKDPEDGTYWIIRFMIDQLPREGTWPSSLVANHHFSGNAR